MIVAYVSGHGYGHATRVSEVLRAVRERDRAMPITIVTSAPEELFRRAIAAPLVFRALECDVGVAQKDALTLDEAGTAVRWRSFHESNGDRVDAEWRWLHHSTARVVLGDVPPLAFQVAAEVGIPSVALANFSWDWIYRHLARRQGDLIEAAAWAAAAYGRCGLLLKLPFAGDLSAFPKAIDIPLVARRPKATRSDVRGRLGLGSGALGLISFGGIPFGGFDPQAFARLRGIDLVTVGPAPEVANVKILALESLASLGLGFEDLVGAVDVVITKPGYGIVSDAIGAGTRIIYTERGDFPEYPILVAGMESLVPCAHVSNADLFAGQIQAQLRDVLSRPIPPAPDLSGAAVAAEQILLAAAR
ncbi:MAG: hypothetical protein ACHQNV_07300 [Vicinamibacteria bacterium]